MVYFVETNASKRARARAQVREEVRLLTLAGHYQEAILKLVVMVGALEERAEHK